MTAEPLPRSTPAAEGVSSAGIAAFLDAVDQDPAMAVHSLMVLRHGRVVAEGWWAPYRREDRRQLYSVSKTFTATALGFALAENRLALNDPVVSHFPDLATEAGPRTRAITVEHLARMATGHQDDTWAAMVARDSAEPIRGFLGLEPETAPGSEFTYNNGATYVLGAIVQARTGQSLTDYLQPRLFDPLGIASPYWDLMGGSRQVGFIGLHLGTEDLAKAALLYAQDGAWAGTPVLPDGWVAAASRNRTPTDAEPNPDWQQGYGYQLWRSRHGYRADGAFGQFGLVLPEQDAVVVLTSEAEQMQPLLDAVWAHLIPALTGPAVAAAEDERLTERLHALGLPVDGAGAAPADDWVAARAVVADDAGWALTLTSGDRTVRVGCGDGAWRRTQVSLGPDRDLVVEGHGRWSDPGTFVADLVFVPTPHRMTVTFTPEDERSAARWWAVPLIGPPLANLATRPTRQGRGSPR